jgi:hypothetical protein
LYDAKDIVLFSGKPVPKKKNKNKKKKKQKKEKKLAE